MNAVKKIVGTIIMLLLVFTLFINISNYIQVKILHKNIATINGYAFLEVVSGSMEPVLNVGDLVVVNTKDKEIDENDVVTYSSSNGSFVTHRVIENLDSGLITKGDANNAKDKDIVKSENVIGKYIFKIPHFGILISSLQNPLTLILILIIGIIICILASTDKNGVPKDITEEEKKFLEYREKKLFIKKYKNRLKVGD